MPMSLVRGANDRQAEIYDEFFADSRIRSDVWKFADRFLIKGRLLDLGCGTGEDALHFTQRGLEVTAIDISPAMIARLKLKCGEAVRYEVGDMCSYGSDKPFEAVFSNFSAVNYVSSLEWLRRIPLLPGGYLVLVTLGRFYPLGAAIFLLKGQFRRVTHRLQSTIEGSLDGSTFTVHYHSLNKIRHDLGPSFELKHVAGLRALSTTPDLRHLERFGVIRLLRPIDAWWCAHRLTAVISDQFISVWQFVG
jgi:SAM-dependent methyltransferase